MAAHFIESKLHRVNEWNVPHVFSDNKECWTVGADDDRTLEALVTATTYSDFLKELPEVEEKPEDALSEEQLKEKEKQAKEEERLRIEQEAKNIRIKKEKEDQEANKNKNELQKINNDELTRQIQMEEELKKQRNEELKKEKLQKKKDNCLVEEEDTPSVFADLFNLKFII